MLLADDGLFISESHYLVPLLETLQYDTVYHEHLRYYSLSSLDYLMKLHGLEIVHAKRIPTHGGSIRVYAARKNTRPVSEAVQQLLRMEESLLTEERFAEFRSRVSSSKLDLMAMLQAIRREGNRVYAVGAPSRASTLVNYVGLDDSIVDCVLEIAGSYKIGKYMPGTLIPVLEEKKLFEDQPEYALLLSWHIGDELAGQAARAGLQGKVHRPSPDPSDSVGPEAHMLHDIRARFTALGEDPESQVDVAIAAGSLMLGLFSFGTLVAVGYLNYTTLPWFDAWDHWIRYLSAKDSWTFLFSMHTEHRIPVSRLLNLADEHWFNADTRFLMWCTFLAQIGSALILFRLACSSAADLSLAFRTTILGLILAFAFAASQWINFTMTFQACFVVVFFAAMAAFAALKNSIQDRGAEERSLSVFWVIVSILMGLISTGSMANGLLVWPLMVLMAVCMGLPKNVVGSLALVGVAVTVAYMRGYQPRAEIHVSNSWMRTPEVVVFASAYLGSALDEPLVATTKAIGLDWESYRVPLSALAGALGVGWFCYLLVLTIRDPRNRRPARIAILCILAFLAASAALTAVGRVQFPMKDALTSRYVTPSLLFWASLFALAIAASSTRRRSKGLGHSYVLRVTAFVAAAVVGGLVTASQSRLCC